MRILFVHNVAPWDARAGGGQHAHHEIALALHRRGNEVKALFLGKSSPPPEPVPYGYSWIPDHPRLLNNVSRVGRATRELSRRWTPDVAYLSSAEAAGTYQVLRGRAGMVMTSHHFEPPQLLDSVAWRRPLRSLRRLRRLQRFYLERHLLRRADRRTAVSEYGRRILYERGYLRPDQVVTVIPNGVGSFWRATPPHEAPRKGFLFVGRMDDQKGVDVLQEALAGCASDWSLDLVGEGWQRSRYEAQARAAGLFGRVRFLGHQSPENVRRAMWGAGALVLPSRSENYPLVLLEAMAAGLPVVATRVGGVPEMVTHGSSGLLAAPSDAADLGRQMDRAAGDERLRARLADGGRKVAARHCWTEVASRLEMELKAAAGTSSGRGATRYVAPAAASAADR